MKNKILKKVLAGVSLGLLAAAAVWLISNIIFHDLFYSYEATTYDSRVLRDIQNVKAQSIEEIVIVDVDARAESYLGKFPFWPRSYHSRVINFLNEGGAAAIGFDIIFPKNIREPEIDAEYVKTVELAENILSAIYFEQADSLNWRYKMQKEPEGFAWEKFCYTLPTEITNKFQSEERIGNEFLDLLNASHSIGHVNFHGDSDGVVRNIHLFTRFNDHIYPSFAFKMYIDILSVDSLDVQLGKYVKLYSQGQLIQNIPIDNLGRMIIEYSGGFKTFRYISFYDVLEQRIPKDFFKNKVIFIGTSLPGLFDLRSTPVHPSYPGVEIHANILHTLLTGNFIQQFSFTENIILLAGIGIIIGLIAVFLSPLWSILVIILLAIIHTVIAYIFYFDNNYWIPIVTPILTFIFTFSVIYLYRYITEEKGKKFIKETFSHFVTQSVVDELLANPDKIKLGGEKKECTVFFSDVAGFTTIAEQLTPEALVRLLNEYLTQMTNIVFKYDGMLDKYEGDAIMAVFGAPVVHGNHAFKACAAAIEMQQQLILLREMWGKQGRPQLYVRCGINTGEMVVGNMGSEVRFDYTVMGDPVNLGARLESANKQYGTAIMIGESTFEMAKDKIFARELDLVRVKGKTEPARVYELLGLSEKGIPDKNKRAVDLFNEGFKNYLGQNWEQALNFFKQATNINPNDGPSRTYIKRCQQFIENPPRDDWDGVFVMTTK